MFSGFVAQIRGLWVYVTAGHILRLIRASLAASGKFDYWRLGDSTAGNAERLRGTVVPFDFEMDRWLVLENPEKGLDYAAVVLRDWYVRALKAGGVVPIGAWGDYVTEHDHWFLVGVPYETVSHDDGSHMEARTVLVPLEPTEPPPGAGERAKNQFFARLAENSIAVVKDVSGMSGGPIFASKRISPDQLKYAVIGVQSGWYQGARIIAACPFSSFAEALEEVVDDALRLAKIQGGDD